MKRWTDKHGMLTPEGVHAMFDALEEAERQKVERMHKARVIRASNGEAAIVSELEYDVPNPYTEEAACRANH